MLATTAHAYKPLNNHDVNVGKRAFAFVERNQWDRAIGVIQEARDPLLRKLVLWQRLRMDERGSTFNDYREFIQQNPQWPMVPQLVRMAEQKIPVSASPQELLEWFRFHPPQTTAGQIAYLDALVRANAGKDFIIEQIKHIWVNTNFSAPAERDFLQRFSKDLSRADHQARMNRVLWDSRFSEAERLLPLVGNDYAALARARMALQRRVAGVDSLVAAVPARLQNDAGLVFERSRWRRRAGNEQGALELIMSAPTLSSHHHLWWREQEYHVRQRLKARDINTAYKLAAHHQMPAGSLSYAEAEFLAGWLALEYRNLPSVAYNHFVNIIQNVSTPISLARGTYWAGIAARRTGDLATANAMLAKASSYPVTFYGQLAALESNTPVRLNASGVRNRQSQKAFESDERVHAVRHLVQLGELRRIDSFIRTLGQHDNEDFIVMAAELAHSLKRYDLSVAIAKQAKAGGVVLPDIEFPLIELPTMARAPEAGLIYAVIRQESVFNPSARSHAGALGMMQLMPATARLEARLMSLPFSSDRLTRDADYNIKMGSHHLSRLVQNFNGSYPLAIAAYNAGSTNVHRWLRDYGDPRTKNISYINWMESIPFRETRNYVHRVLEGLEVYRLRLESNPSHKIPLTEAYAWCSVSCPIVQEELKRANVAQAQ